MRANANVRRPAAWVAAAVALLLGSVCRSAEPPPAPAPPAAAPAAGPGAAARVPELVPAAELARLEAELLDRLAADRSRVCARPVLRGTPLPGPADADALAVVQPEATDARACTERAAAHEAPLKAWLAAPGPEVPAAVREVAAACAALEPLVARATAHEDACSPFLVGRRAAPSLLGLLRTARGVAAHVRLLARDGEPDRALALATDWLRLMQDLGRGEGAPVLVRMVGVGSSGAVLDGIGAILDAPGTLPAATLERLEAELAALLAAEPPFGGHLAAERTWLGVTGALAGVHGPGWTPPAGWPAGFEPAAAVADGEHLAGLDPRQEWALLWAVWDGSARALEAACPVDADLPACHAGLAKEAERRAAEAELSGIARVIRFLRAPDAVTGLRTEVGGLLSAVAAPDLAPQVARLGVFRARLAALRLQAGVLRAAATDGACPGAPEVTAGERWAAWRAVPGTGTALAVSAPEPGRFQVALAGWLAARARDQDVLRFACAVRTPPDEQE